MENLPLSEMENLVSKIGLARPMEGLRTPEPEEPGAAMKIDGKRVSEKMISTDLLLTSEIRERYEQSKEQLFH